MLRLIQIECEAMSEDPKRIVEMIETVESTDTAKLDEIDARLDCFLNGWWFKGFADPNDFEEEDWPVFMAGRNSFPDVKMKAEQYTRSRDAIKKIRPSGFWPIKLFKDGHVFRFELTNGSRIASSAWLQTEELAELHSTFQSILLERALRAVQSAPFFPGGPETVKEGA